MNLATTLAIFICFVLAAAVIWRLMTAHQPSPAVDASSRSVSGHPPDRLPRVTSHTPSIVGGLIGVALGVVLCQAAWLLLTTQNPPSDNPDGPAKLVETERLAREKDIATVTTRLADLSKKQDAAQTDISKIREDVGKLAAAQTSIDDASKTMDATLKPMTDKLSKLELRVSNLEPRAPRVTISGLKVSKTTPNRKPVLLKGKPALGLFPQTTGGTIQFASIQFYPPPGGTGAPTPAPDNYGPNGGNCRESFICHGKPGLFVTIPSTVVASAAQVCIRLSYTLQDRPPDFAWGGPITPVDGAVWPSTSNTQSPCDPAQKP